MKLSEAITYDLNGNLTNDYYKGLQIGYDVLNRTDKITVTTGTNQYIYYTYDASGDLIRKQEYNNNVLGTTTDYIDGFVYLNSTLSYFPMPEGRVLNNGGGTFKQEFIITDQQGNARVSFQDNGSGVAVVKQENSYYGFGLILPNSPVGLPTPPNRQLYNGGSEWQNDYSNLPDYYQTFNRNYDAALGRFVGVDPVAESAESMTSYQYAGNMPIMMNDPMGDKTVPGNTYNVNYVSPLSPQMGPLDANWQNEGAFTDFMYQWGPILAGAGVGLNSNGTVQSISPIKLTAGDWCPTCTGVNVNILNGQVESVERNGGDQNTYTAGNISDQVYSDSFGGDWDEETHSFQSITAAQAQALITNNGISVDLGDNQGGALFLASGSVIGESTPITSLTTYFPPNNGFAEPPTFSPIPKGTILSRYGPSGYNYSNPGYPSTMRSLPPENNLIENLYTVAKDGLEGWVGTAAAWFGQLGGAPQVTTVKSTLEMLDDGTITINDAGVGTAEILPGKIIE